MKKVFLLLVVILGCNTSINNEEEISIKGITADGVWYLCDQLIKDKNLTTLQQRESKVQLPKNVEVQVIGDVFDVEEEGLLDEFRISLLRSDFKNSRFIYITASNKHKDIVMSIKKKDTIDVRGKIIKCSSYNHATFLYVRANKIKILKNE